MKGAARLLAVATVCVGVCLLPSGATAQSAPQRVAVLTGPDGAERPGFVDQLRIQLGREASVIRSGAVGGSTQSEQVESASFAMQGVNATLGVWLQGPLQRSDGEREITMIVVGRQHGRAVVDVVRLQANEDDPALDRTLALKLQGILHELPAEGGVIGAGLAAPPATTPPPATALAPQHVRVLVELGALGVAPSGSADVRAGVSGALGARLETNALGVDLVGGALWLARSTERSASGLVQANELVPFASVRAGVHLDDVRLGGLLSVRLRIVQAEGTTARGTPGNETVLLTAIAAGPELVWSLTPALGLRVAAPFELSLRRQRFTLNREVIARTGRLRPSAVLALQAAWPEP